MEEIIKQIDCIETYLLQVKGNSYDEFNDLEVNLIPNNTNVVDHVLRLISNKSNFCSEKFIEDIRYYLNQVGSGLNRFSIDSIHQERKQPIDF